jgi:hypothetical protein
MSKISFTRGSFEYVFERSINHNQSRESIDVVKTDYIRLVKVFDRKFDKEIDPHTHKAKITRQAWESLIRDVKVYTCSICGEHCPGPKNKCINARYHFPNGK